MKPIIKNLLALGIFALTLVTALNTDAQIRIYGGRPRIYSGIEIGLYPGSRYYYNPYGAYYGYAYPRIGLSYGLLPYGYLPFYFGADLYYAYNGVYYRQLDDRSYQVVAPPIGAEVPQLPSRARSLMINNQQYFELNGVYYKPNVKADGTHDYLIAGKDGVLSTNVVPVPPAPPANAPQPNNGKPPVNNPPVNYDQQQAPSQTPVANSTTPLPKTGDVVTQLPDGCKAVTVAGKKYFVSGTDVYYEEFNNSGKVGYKVAGTPGEQ